MVPHTPPTLTEGLTLHVSISFSKAISDFLAISPEIATFIPQGATPAPGHSALWRANIEGQQGVWICLLINCFVEAKHPSEFTRKDEYGRNPLLQKVKKLFFYFFLQ